MLKDLNESDVCGELTGKLLKIGDQELIRKMDTEKAPTAVVGQAKSRQKSG